VAIGSAGLLLGGVMIATPTSATPAASGLTSDASAAVIGPEHGALSGVSCPSPTFCIAVGNAAVGSTTEPLIERWDGTGWSVVAGPSIDGATSSELSGVSCPTPTTCIAVGSVTMSIAAGTRTLVEEWVNGGAWSIVTGPDLGGASPSSLAGVSCSSAASCFAVGAAGDSTLAEFWDGSSWSVVPSLNPGNLFGVSCPSATSCYAVGESGTDTLVEHWDGNTWSVMPSASTQHEFGPGLVGVACSSPTSCYAVGYAVGLFSPSAFTESSTNGSPWSIVSQREPATRVGVACPGATVCFSVGDYMPDPSHDHTLVERLTNSGAWSIVASPNPYRAGPSTLSGVSCATATSCFAVGHYYRILAQTTLIERWDGKAWTISNPIEAHTSSNCVIRSTASGKFVSTELHGTGRLYRALRARAGTVGPWERYRCIALDATEWAIKSLANGKYVAAEASYPGSRYGTLRARASAIGPLETFTISSVPGCSCVALGATNSKYVSAELRDAGSAQGLLRARSASIGSWEKFEITPS
jgi:hypothetical protein